MPIRTPRRGRKKRGRPARGLTARLAVMLTDEQMHELVERAGGKKALPEFVRETFNKALGKGKRKKHSFGKSH